MTLDRQAREIRSRLIQSLIGGSSLEKDLTAKRLRACSTIHRLCSSWRFHRFFSKNSFCDDCIIFPQRG